MGSGFRPNGNKIRDMRIQKGWPQEQLARIADVSPRTIQRVEAGGNASFETLRSVAGAFELEVHELMQPPEKPANAETSEQRCQARGQAAEGDSLPVSVSRPIVSVLRIGLGTAASVLLVVLAIRLSPSFRVAPIPSTRITEPVHPSSQSLSHFPLAMRAWIREEMPIKAVVPTPGPRPLERKIKLGPNRDRTVRGTESTNDALRSAIVEREQGRTLGAIPVSEAKSEGRIISEALEVKQLSELARPESAADTGLGESRLNTLEAPAAQASVPRAEKVLEELTNRGLAGASGSVSRAFRRSGKSTATFFSKVGDSIKKVF